MDITERMKADAEKERLHAAENALEIAKKASVAKTEFLSRMSHDIRTPLNAIIGMTHLAEEANDLSEIHNYLNHIASSSDFLLGLINDILDMSKIESGDLTLNPEPYPMEEFLQSINTIIKPLMDAKQIDFKFDMENETRCVLIDKLRFNQIFFNLLSNAAKFTPAGGRVEFTAKHLSKKEGVAGARFTVKDNGVGMSREFLPHIFEAFAQERASGTEQEPGTGLGLPIVKSLVDAMGGTIQVTSEQGRGTKYTIELYAPIAEDKIAETNIVTDVYHLAGTEILLVEDNNMNILVARKLLENEGCHVTIAKNGQEAVRCFKESPEYFFHAILMDVRMPVMDGLEATRRIRQTNRKDAKSVRIIAMTADAFAEEQKKTIGAGMDYHLTKPIQPALMYEALQQKKEEIPV